MDLRQQIQDRMKKRGLTQTAISRATGIFQPNLSRYLAGKRDLRGSSIEQLLNILGGRRITWGRATLGPLQAEIASRRTRRGPGGRRAAKGVAG